MISFLKVLCKSHPVEFASYFHYCHSLTFDQQPDCGLLKRLFSELFACEGTAAGMPRNIVLQMMQTGFCWEKLVELTNREKIFQEFTDLCNIYYLKRIVPKLLAVSVVARYCHGKSSLILWQMSVDWGCWTSYKGTITRLFSSVQRLSGLGNMSIGAWLDGIWPGWFYFCVSATLIVYVFWSCILLVLWSMKNHYLVSERYLGP